MLWLDRIYQDRRLRREPSQFNECRSVHPGTKFQVGSLISIVLVLSVHSFQQHVKKYKTPTEKMLISLGVLFSGSRLWWPEFAYESKGRKFESCRARFMLAAAMNP